MLGLIKATEQDTRVYYMKSLALTQLDQQEYTYKICPSVAPVDYVTFLMEEFGKLSSHIVKHKLRRKGSEQDHLEGIQTALAHMSIVLMGAGNVSPKMEKFAVAYNEALDCVQNSSVPNADSVRESYYLEMVKLVPYVINGSTLQVDHGFLVNLLCLMEKVSQLYLEKNLALCITQVAPIVFSRPADHK